MEKQFKYKSWHDLSIFCHLSEQDCGNCWYAKTFNKNKNATKESRKCFMPSSVEDLLGSGKVMPKSKKEEIENDIKNLRERKGEAPR